MRQSEKRCGRDTWHGGKLRPQAAKTRFLPIEASTVLALSLPLTPSAKSRFSVPDATRHALALSPPAPKP